MINALELRVGNWVKVKENNPIKVSIEILFGICNDAFYSNITNPNNQ